MRGLCFFQNLILIGMPDAGKSYLSQYISQKTNVPVYDTDSFLTLPEKNDKKSWYSYRKEEQKMIEKLIKDPPFPKIISTGGGCIENHQVFSKILNRNEHDIVVHIISDKFRKQEKVLEDSYENLWMKRGKYYFQLADHNYWNNGNADDFYRWYHQEII